MKSDHLHPLSLSFPYVKIFSTLVSRTAYGRPGLHYYNYSFYTHWLLIPYSNSGGTELKEKNTYPIKKKIVGIKCGVKPGN